MTNTPFSAKTLDPDQRDLDTIERRRKSLTRRPWLIRCSYRNAMQAICRSLPQQPERNSSNDCSGERSRRLQFAIGTLQFAICNVILLVALGSSAVHAAPPEETLRSYGLQRVEKTWLVPAEVELHDRLEELGKLERRLQDSKRECDAQIASIEQLRAQLKTAEETKARLATVLKTAPAGQLRTMLEKDQKDQTQLAAKLKESLPPSETLGGLAPLKGMFAEQCALRAEFVLGYFETSRLETAAAKQYADLAENREIKDALAALPNQTLGPAKRFIGEQRTLQKYRATALGPAAPLYREGKRLRVSMILNEELPATLSWHEEHEATLLPISLAQSLGLAEKLTGKQEQLTLPKEKLTLRGWFVTLDRIRVGQSVAENVPVFILAPEYEAIGGRLGYDLQQQMLLSLDAEHLQLKCGLRQKSSETSK
jgi:hypothetical protein